MHFVQPPNKPIPFSQSFVPHVPQTKPTNNHYYYVLCSFHGATTPFHTVRTRAASHKVYVTHSRRQRRSSDSGPSPPHPLSYIYIDTGASQQKRLRPCVRCSSNECLPIKKTANYPRIPPIACASACPRLRQDSSGASDQTFISFIPIFICYRFRLRADASVLVRRCACATEAEPALELILFLCATGTALMTCSGRLRRAPPTGATRTLALSSSAQRLLYIIFIELF